MRIVGSVFDSPPQQLTPQIGIGNQFLLFTKHDERRLTRIFERALFNQPQQPKGHLRREIDFEPKSACGRLVPQAGRVRRAGTPLRGIPQFLAVPVSERIHSGADGFPHAIFQPCKELTTEKRIAST